MKKNVKGFIGLFLGLGAIILIGVSIFLPTEQIDGSSLSLPGKTNAIIALIAFFVGIAAIVFGVTSRKDKDKTGPRKAGVIIGVIAIILALISSALCSLLHLFVNYANGKIDQEIIADMDQKSLDKLDKYIEDIRSEFPAK